MGMFHGEEWHLAFWGICVNRRSVKVVESKPSAPFGRPSIRKLFPWLQFSASLAHDSKLGTLVLRACKSKVLASAYLLQKRHAVRSH